MLRPDRAPSAFIRFHVISARQVRFRRDKLPLRHSECAGRLGLRWQAQRDTAFARTEILRSQFGSRPPESAVAAPALPAHSKIVHHEMNSGKEPFKCGMGSAECGMRPNLISVIAKPA
jgi:hypothetical protein